MQLQNAELVESQTSGRLQIHREHLVLEGESQGEVVHDYMQLETDKGPFFIGMWLSRMGVEVPEEAEKLEEVLADLVQQAPMYTAKITISDGGFTNVRVLKKLESQMPEAEAEAEAEPEAEEESSDEVTTKLLAFAQAQDLEVEENASAADLITAITAWDWAAAELTKDEIELLKSIEASIVYPEKKPAPKVQPKPVLKPAVKWQAVLRSKK